jgi:hypothetical protein
MLVAACPQPACRASSAAWLNGAQRLQRSYDVRLAIIFLIVLFPRERTGPWGWQVQAPVGGAALQYFKELVHLQGQAPPSTQPPTNCQTVAGGQLPRHLLTLNALARPSSVCKSLKLGDPPDCSREAIRAA